MPQLILLDTVAPPIVALLWRFMAGGWATAVQGDKVSEETRRRQWVAFKAFLVMGYVIMFGFTVYAWLT